MVNHPNRSADMYSSLDAVRLTLMVQKALHGLSKEPRITATMVAEKAMVDTFDDVIPPFADGGVYRHVLKFAGLLLKAKYDPGDEEFMKEPLPGEDAQCHADRLRREAFELQKRASALEALGLAMP